MINRHHLLVAGLALSLVGTFCTSAFGQKPKVVKEKDTPKKDASADSAEPDKVLYDRAIAEVKKTHYPEARLDFQTLVNTYPDSEYLAKAKLGIADSFYREGGTSSLTQAIEEYKNFIVFFPFLDEAQYAQMQVGMAHYKLMEKADRDSSHAQAAEDEFRTFLLKYPQSPYVPQAEQSMRNVQEVLAQSDFGVARFYYLKRDYRASAARLVEVTNRYPLFSASDDALWMLGDIYMRARQGVKNEDAKNQFTDMAAKCYDRIVQDYPGSRWSAAAKEQLKSISRPIPAPNPDAMGRMKQQQLYEKEHHQIALLRLPENMVKSSPDFSLAARTGTPNLTPPDDVVSAMEVLTPNASGASFSVRAAPASSSSGGSGSTNASTADSESVVTEDTAAAGTESSSSFTAASVVGTSGAGNSAPAAATPTSAEPPAPAAEVPATTNPPAETSPSAGTSAAATEVNSAPAAVRASAPAAAATPGSTASQSGTSTAQKPQASGSTGSTSTTPAQADQADPKTESSSKKKKGLHKIIPF